ncbi:MAG: hypothetical protein AABZ30_00215, partial [Myxococcota bacterium]
MRRFLPLALAIVACGGKQKVDANVGFGAEGGGAQPSPAPTQDRTRCDATGKRIVKMDLNKDKNADVFKMFATRKEDGQNVEFLSCKEVDINFDGRKDVWFYYGDNGERTREEMDLDFDGKIDLVTYRTAEKVVRQELDTDFDGKADIWRHFEGEKIARLERDSDRNGSIDYWEYYEGGAIDRVGYDLDNDGKVDRWDRAPPPEVPAAAAAPAAPAPTAARRALSGRWQAVRLGASFGAAAMGYFAFQANREGLVTRDAT